MSASSVVSPGVSDEDGRAVLHPRKPHFRFRRFFGSAWWKLDVSLLCIALLGTTLFWGNRTHTVRFVEVLALRISLINCLFAVGCIWLWRLIMTSLRTEFRSKRASLPSMLLELAFRITTCASLGAIALWVRHPQKVTPGELFAFWLASLALCLGSRLVRIALSTYVEPLLRGDRRVVIVGTGWRAERCAEEICAHPDCHYEILGFVDNEPQIQRSDYLGKTDDLESILMRQVVDEVIIALPMKSKYDDIQTAIDACERLGIQSEYSTDLFATKIAKRRSEGIQDAASIVLHMVHNDRRLYVKRAIDLIGAFLALILLAIPMLIVAIAVRFTSEGPIIFRQQRFGLKKRVFNMYKFRSMVVDAEQQQSRVEHLNEAGGPVFKMRQDPRVTLVGRFIRKTSLDELPQLFNVLRGDMSLVGPRPLPMRDVTRFSEAWLMRRFSVRPGLTGLWQVSGRSGTSFAHWIKLDLEYIDAWSLILDFKILARTLPAVLKREGAV